MIKTITKRTRAPRSGKLIYCPKCNNSSRVFHFSWSALVCDKCNRVIKKHEFLLESQPEYTKFLNRLTQP